MRNGQISKRFVISILNFLLVASSFAEGPGPATTVGHCSYYQTGKMNVYWGDLHSHSVYSLDAYGFGTRRDPFDAYLFAKGTPAVTSNGTQFVIDADPVTGAPRPLDFLAPTDHSEFLGSAYGCNDPSAVPSSIYNSPYCADTRKATQAVDGNTINLFAILPSVCSLFPSSCQQTISNFWTKVQQAAAENNEPCSFTAFPAYEYTYGTSTTTLHRNVIFANAVVPALPLDSDSYPTPNLMRPALKSQCSKANGCDVLLIPHNANQSNGREWQVEGETPDDLRLRGEMEVLVEIHQHKGSSECYQNPNLDDAYCNFEITKRTSTDASKPGYVRPGLLTGLEYMAKNGFDPFKLGFVGATDNHNAVPGNVSESDWNGNIGPGDDTPYQRITGEPDYNPGGITAVWAEENTRESIFAALKAKRTYATSGPRITVQSFQTWQQTGDPCGGANVSRDSFMGGDLPPAPSKWIFPRYVVSAIQDRTPLDHIDIIKLNVDSNGIPHETVVALTNSQPPSKNGYATLCGTWTDKKYDPKTPSMVYARVMEVPVQRWAHFDCQALAKDPSQWTPQVQKNCAQYDKMIQERAWTSPIYSLPTVVAAAPPSSAAQLAAQYQFVIEDGGPYTNYRGADEKYFMGTSLNSDNRGWYYILPTGAVYAFSFSGGLAGSQLIGNVDPSYYANPLLLINAALPTDLITDVSGFESTYDIGTDPSGIYLNYRGWGEEYLRGDSLGANNGGWYVVIPTGVVYSWGGSLETSLPIANLGPAFFKTAQTLRLYSAPVSLTAVSSLFFSAGENNHKPVAQSCPGGTKFVGNFADCGGGWCYGNEMVCERTQQIPIYSSSTVPAIIDVTVTKNGAHIVGSPGCPAGYTPIGSGADCGGGVCYGNQLYCAAVVPASQVLKGSALVTDVVITLSNLHVAGGPGCPDGYRDRGVLEDCGYGKCRGQQEVCVKYGLAP